MRKFSQTHITIFVNRIELILLILLVSAYCDLLLYHLHHPPPASLQHFNKIYTASASVPPVAGTLRSYVRNKEREFNKVFYFDNDFVSANTSFLTQM
jgi:hypothetical protein